MKRITDIINILQKRITPYAEVVSLTALAFLAILVIPAVAETQTNTQSNAVQTQTIISDAVLDTNVQQVASWHDMQTAGVEIQGVDTEKIDGGYEQAEALAQHKADEQVVAELTQEVPFTFDPELPFGYKISREVVVEVSGYNPLPEQTDSTPCITASGKNICEGEHAVIAANWLKFGTKVVIPEYFGDTVFTVEDRMNPRYPYNVDVLFYDKGEAKRLGRRKLLIQVLEESEVQIASR